MERVTEESNGIVDSSGDSSQGETSRDNVLYHVAYDSPNGCNQAVLRLYDVRPRAQYRLQWAQIAVGQKVMANYNPDNPKERGYWYDVELTRKVEDDYRELYCRLLLSGGDSHSCICTSYTQYL